MPVDILNSSTVDRLGVLLSNVLHLEPFASTKRAWNTIMLRPFMNGNPRASIAVAGLMHRIMIRNRREDISKDVTLPQLYKRLVFLDFDYYQWMVSIISTSPMSSPYSHNMYFVSL